MIRRPTASPARLAKLLAAAAIACLGLSGCESTPKGATGAPLQESDFGPLPADHSTIFAGYLASYLKDPYSAQVTHYAGPAKFVGATGFSFNVKGYGWASCYAVNAKNSFGGYTGARAYLAVIRNGRIVEVARAGETIYIDADISRFCNSNPKVSALAAATAPAAAGPDPRRVTRDALTSLKPNTSTRADAERLFGPPNSISTVGRQTLLQWITSGTTAHVAILFDDSAEQRMVQVTHSFFQ